MSVQQWPRGGGATGALVRTFDWSATALGPIENWSPPLKATVEIILQSSVAMVLLWGRDGVLVYNDGYAEIASARHPSILGAKALDAWPELAEFNRVVLKRGFDGEVWSLKSQELNVLRNGMPETIWLDLNYQPVRDESDEVTGILVIVLDDTQRMQAEKQRANAVIELQRVNDTLRAEREAVQNANLRLASETKLLRGLFEQAPSFMALLRGPEHVYELVNAPYFKLIGDRDVLGLPIREALPELEGQGFYELLDDVYRSGRTFTANQRRVLLRTADGTLEERFLDFVYQPIRHDDGQVLGIFVEGADVTERFLSDERLEIAQRAGGIGVFEWFPESKTLVVSDEYRRIWGLPKDVVVTDDLLVGLVDPQDRLTTGPAKLAKRENPIEYAEYRITRPEDGEVRWIARRGEVVRGDERAHKRYIGVCFDITQRRRVEEALRTLNETLEAQVAERTRERDRIWRVSQDLLLVSDENGVFLSANPAWEAALGWSEIELVGNTYRWLVHPDDLALSDAEHAKIVNGARSSRFENRVRHKDGGYRWLSWTATPEAGRIYSVARDVTAEKAAAEALRATEDALRQAQKMEAVGQLTGGLAHDFNNLLQGIVGSLSVVTKLANLGRTAEIDRFVSMAMSSANRAASLTHRLLAFSRRQPLNPRPAEINALIESMEDLLRRTMGESVEISLVLASDLWLTLCDHNQLENAILNLAINARDAMPNGGKLTIETCNAHLDDAFAAAQRDLTPGQYVCVCVTDTGTGMSPEVLSRAFDPFFTTKPMGQGTGLGLSMIYGFARQSDGHARIYSEIGRGTTVKLYLPRYHGQKDVAAATAADADVDTPVAGSETILVVEDELVVRQLIVEALRDLGYRTLEAIDGPSGLRILNSSERIDLLVTDIGLPGINGRQLADNARVTRPDLQVLFMTGYAEAAAFTNGILAPGMQMLTKPFAMDVLASRVQSIIEESRPPT